MCSALQKPSTVSEGSFTGMGSSLRSFGDLPEGRRVGSICSSDMEKHLHTREAFSICAFEDPTRNYFDAALGLIQIAERTQFELELPHLVEQIDRLARAVQDRRQPPPIALAGEGDNNPRRLSST